MKPDEHMKSPEDELITHIKESLMAHEEEYVPGAWEHFNKEDRKQKKGLIYWITGLSSAAAILLIGVALALFTGHKEQSKQNQNTFNKSGDQHPDQLAQKSVPDPEKSGEEKVIPMTADAVPKVKEPAMTTSSNDKLVRLNSTPQGISNDVASVKSEATVTNPVVSDPAAISNAKASNNINVPVVSMREPVVAQVKPQEKKQSFEEFLKEESRNVAATADVSKRVSAKKENKWEMGVLVAPSFGNDKKLNVGYGVSMAYALNDKLSIGSGIAYNEMGATKNMDVPASGGIQNAPAPNNFIANDSRTLKSVNANLRGIDIPLEIRYNISKKLYANVGVSAFAILEKKQENVFLDSKVEVLSAEADGPLGATTTFRTVVTNKAVSEAVPEKEAETSKYLGFYNLSFGYKQKISKGKAFAIEPFLKLPIKDFSKENLYLIGTGVKLRFDF